MVLLIDNLFIMKNKVNLILVMGLFCLLYGCETTSKEEPEIPVVEIFEPSTQRNEDLYIIEYDTLSQGMFSSIWYLYHDETTQLLADFKVRNEIYYITTSSGNVYNLSSLILSFYTPIGEEKKNIKPGYYHLLINDADPKPYCLASYHHSLKYYTGVEYLYDTNRLRKVNAIQAEFHVISYKPGNYEYEIRMILEDGNAYYYHYKNRYIYFI